MSAYLTSVSVVTPMGLVCMYLFILKYSFRRSKEAILRRPSAISWGEDFHIRPYEDEPQFRQTKCKLLKC